MRLPIPIALFAVVFIAACNNGTVNTSKYLDPANLPAQVFTINTQEDTAIVTKQGIKISIPANAIEANTKTVTLLVKEALNIDDILKAGLTTNAGKVLLTSDGMFYIGTKEKASVKKPLQVLLPTVAADSGMKLFKGVEKDGKIDWQDPKPIQKPVTNITDPGEVIYKSKCASCHNVETDGTGPALAWAGMRLPTDWLRKFTLNAEQVASSGDLYACRLLNKYKTSMPVFSFTNNEIDAIYRYIDKVSKQKGLPEPAKQGMNDDSCGYYRNYYSNMVLKRDSLVKNNGNLDTIKIIEPKDTDPNADNGIVPIKVNPELFDAEYYQFKIDAFGWYNIDDLLQGRFNSVESTLKVILQNAQTEKINVFLTIPEYKVYNKGGLLNDGSSYGFYKQDGQVILPQKANAYVFALGEEGGKIYFGASHFTTSLSQSIAVTIHESSQKEVNDFFKDFKIKGLNISAEKTKNFAGIKQLDEAMKYALQKIAGCNCGESDTSYIASPPQKTP